jgi:hypothetical protein
MIVIQDIVPMQDWLTQKWHEPPSSDSDEDPNAAKSTLSNKQRVRRDWLALVARQHRANFDLWHIEDEARKPGASNAELADVKRRIDLTNQVRNDLAEELDRMLLSWLKPRRLPDPGASLHSETPGLIIDRLSILSLKIYHTREEVERKHAPEGHGPRNRERLAVLEKQRRDLAGCLDVLWKEIEGGTRRFELYRQLKMYNDPSLNPVIYRNSEVKKS